MTIIQPTITREDHYGGPEDTYSHPAFGRIELSRRHGGPVRLFGSDLQHHETMHLRIGRATIRRGLNSDRISGGNIITELEFSLAQWSQFVASQGIGAGTPCTLRTVPTADSRLENTPDIGAPAESHTGKFTREMREALAERTDGVRQALASMQAALDIGSKAAMRAALKEAQRHADQLPGSVAFVNDQFAASMETIVSDAKTEVEGFVVGMALRTGVKQLADAAPSIGLLSDD